MVGKLASIFGLGLTLVPETCDLRQTIGLEGSGLHHLIGIEVLMKHTRSGFYEISAPQRENGSDCSTFSFVHVHIMHIIAIRAYSTALRRVAWFIKVPVRPLPLTSFRCFGLLWIAFLTSTAGGQGSERIPFLPLSLSYVLANEEEFLRYSFQSFKGIR
jgi:hypothetical protein